MPGLSLMLPWMCQQYRPSYAMASRISSAPEAAYAEPHSALISVPPDSMMVKIFSAPTVLGVPCVGSFC